MTLRLNNVNDQRQFAELSDDEVNDLVRLFCAATSTSGDTAGLSDSKTVTIKSSAAMFCSRFASRIDDSDEQLSERQIVLARLIRLYELQSDFERTMQREKLASLKQLAYGASHEVNNPLGNVATRAQTLMRSETDPERRRQLAMIVSQTFRAHDMIGDMMLYAHPPTPNFSQIDLRKVVEKAIAEIRPFAEMQETIIQFRCDGDVTAITADPDQIASMIIALVRNGLDSIVRGGTITVELASAEHENEDSMKVRVTDDGPGLSELARRHLFDPFFWREAGRGLGFGLCKAKTITELHGGEIRVDAQRAGGVSFDVILPAKNSLNEH